MSATMSSSLMRNSKRRSVGSASEELTRRKRARNSYIEYTKAIDIPGVPGDHDPEEWLIQPIESQVAKHHYLIVDACDRLIHGTLVDEELGVADGVMIFAPPGSAKSTYCDVVVPSAAMGEFSNYDVVLASYGSKIIWKHSRRCRQVVSSDKYHAIWNTTVSKQAGSVEYWELDNGSTCVAGGILSGIGGHRADLLVLDDFFSGREDADSELIQEKTWEEYNDVLVMRLKPGGKQIMVTTRWVENDPCGRLLPEGWHGESGFIRGTDGRVWFVLCIQAECKRKDDPLGREIGEFLWVDWFGERHFRLIRDNPTRQRTWNALCQQVPTAEDGTFFRRHWFGRHTELPKNLTYIASIDSAETPDGGDKTWILVWGIGEWMVYLADIYVDQVDTGTWVDHLCGNLSSRRRGDPEIIGLCRMWDIEAIVPDQDNIWGAVEPFVKRRLAEEHRFVTVMPQPHGGKGKPARATSFQGLASSGRVSLPLNHPHVEEFINEHMKFPTGAQDGAVDSSGAMGRYINKIWADETDRKPPPDPESLVNPEEGMVELDFNDVFARTPKEKKW